MVLARGLRAISRQAKRAALFSPIHHKPKTEDAQYHHSQRRGFGAARAIMPGQSEGPMLSLVRSLTVKLKPSSGRRVEDPA